jgi:hypothetical protein
MKTFGDYISNILFNIELMGMFIYGIFHALCVGVGAIFAILCGVGLWFVAFFAIAFFVQSVFSLF